MKPRYLMAAAIFFAVLLTVVSSPARGANLGTKYDPGPAGTTQPTAYNWPMGQWQDIFVSGTPCAAAFQLGNIFNAGYGRLGDQSACTSTYMKIVIVVGVAPNTFLVAVPSAQFCTWSSTAGTIGGCSILADSGDMWLQQTAPNSIVSATVEACYYSTCSKRTYTPLPS